MNKNPTVSRNAPCPCGSGKKYKRCCALKGEQEASSHRQLKRTLKWIGGAAVLLLVGYGIFQKGPVSGPIGYNPLVSEGSRGSVYYTDSDITAVDFSGLTQVQREKVLDKTNKMQCPCGCAMTLAQCVAVDRTCPLRSSNIKQMRDLVKELSG